MNLSGNKSKNYKKLSTLGKAALLLLVANSAMAEVKNENKYIQENFVANKAKYKAETVTKDFINAWGLAIRPAGAGGHFWVTAKDVSYEYVGDVRASKDEKLKKLHQDDLKEIKLPVGGDDKFATGVVFNSKPENFVVSQKLENGEVLTAGSKFIFASDGGIISAWTEQKNPDGSFKRPNHADKVIDYSDKGAQFFGLAINQAEDRLYAANFGVNPDILVFDKNFKPAAIKFEQPFDANKNGKVEIGEYAPFNVQAIKNQAGKTTIFVAYAKTMECNAEGIKDKACKAGEIFPGEENIKEQGSGKLAEFTENGKLIATWDDAGKLDAPWGIALAPDNFGALSNKLLVTNFEGGKIAAFDTKTRKFSDYLKDNKGQDLKIDKIWGILFGNGVSLGDTNALYFAAGPDDEKDGLFGVIRQAE